MEITYKEFWIQAYLALLQHQDPEKARDSADKALVICDERWKTPVIEGTVRLVANKPVGAPDYSRATVVREDAEPIGTPTRS